MISCEYVKAITWVIPHEDSLILTPANDSTEVGRDMQENDADALLLTPNEIYLFDPQIRSDGLPWTNLLDETIRF